MSVIRIFLSVIFCLLLFDKPVSAQFIGNDYSSRSLSVQFDNDTYYETDYYYTYGLKIGVRLPSFNDSPWKGVFVKLPGSQNVSGFYLAQKLYTPKNIRDTLVQFDDRPFSATLELSQQWKSLDTMSGLILKSQFRIGIIGPTAGGEMLQKKIHDWIDSPDPNGWKYQIENAVILNYDIGISYPFIIGNMIRISGDGTLRLGTLNDDIETGINLLFGNDPHSGKDSFGVWFQLYGAGRLVAYNATLQGGLFTNNQYDMSWNQITPTIFTGSAEAGIFFKGISLRYLHKYLSKEFKNGIDHNYGSFRLIFSF